MKTKDTDYGRYFPIEEGGFPEEYPYKQQFHHYIHKMGMLLRCIKNPDLAEDEFLDMLESLHTDGFTNFYKHCWEQYKAILLKRITDLENNINGKWDLNPMDGGD